MDNNYNRGTLNVEHAMFLIDNSVKSQKLKYPKDNKELRDNCLIAEKFVKDNKLTNTSYFDVLNEELPKLEYLNTDKESEFTKTIFLRIQGILEGSGWLL